MTTHIYAFGSICRGEVTRGSDVDLLACVAKGDDRFDPDVYSVYTHDRIRQLWAQGNPFAWHLSKESRLIFAADGYDFLHELGLPASYALAELDCKKFYKLFVESRDALTENSNSKVFNLSSLFLSIRNISTCYSISVSKPVFSRNAAFLIDIPAPLSRCSFDLLEHARILATRGIGEPPTDDEIKTVLAELGQVDEWMNSLILKVQSP